MATRIQKIDSCVNCDVCIGRRNCYQATEIELDELICDTCGNAVDELYVTDNGQECAECILGEFKQIDADNFADFVEEE